MYLKLLFQKLYKINPLGIIIKNLETLCTYEAQLQASLEVVKLQGLQIQLSSAALPKTQVDYTVSVDTVNCLIKENKGATADVTGTPL